MGRDCGVAVVFDHTPHSGYLHWPSAPSSAPGDSYDFIDPHVNHASPHGQPLFAGVIPSDSPGDFDRFVAFPYSYLQAITHWLCHAPFEYERMVMARLWVGQLGYYWHCCRMAVELGGVARRNADDHC